MQSLKEGLEESALQTTTTITSLDWTQFGLGLGLGAITSIASNVSNQCLSSVSSVLQSIYLIYYYLSGYLATQSTDDAAYATTYLIKLMNSGFDLSYCETYINIIFPFLIVNDNIMKQSVDQSLSSIYNIIQQYIYLFGDLQNVIGLFEIVIDSQTIYNEWLAQDYFEAGLFTGKGVANAYFTMFAIIKVYLPNL